MRALKRTESVRHLVKRERPVQASTSHISPKVTEGIVRQVDLIGRIVTVDTKDRSIAFAVSPVCEILLNGERVKLRLLQPRDRVRVAYRDRGGAFAALSVEATSRS